MPRQVNRPNKRLLTALPRLSHLSAATLLASLLGASGAAQAATCTTGNGVTQIGVQLFALQAYEDGSFEYSWRQLRCDRGQVSTLVGTTLQGQYPEQAIADAQRMGALSRVIRNACGSLAVIVHDRFRGKIQDASGASVDFEQLARNQTYHDLFQHSLQDSEGKPIACPGAVASQEPPPDFCPAPGMGGGDMDGAFIGNPIVAASGDKLQQDTDYASAHPSAALRFGRQWASSRALGDRAGAASALGPGWQHNHSASLQALPNGDLQLILPDGRIRHFKPAGQTGAYDSPTPYETLKATPQGHEYQHQHTGDALRFDAQGKLISRTQRNGWITTYHYNASGQLQSIQAPFGQSLRLDYKDSPTGKQLARITAHDGSHTSYGYDSQGRLTTVTHADGSKRQYLYEDAQRPNLLTGIVGEMGQRIATWAYDGQGRATLSEQGAGTARHHIRYGQSQPAGQLQAAATVTGPDGQARSYQYQKAGTGWAVTGASHIPLDESIDPMRSRQLRDGLIERSTDFAGNTQTHEWNARHLPTRHTRAAGKPEQTQVQTEWHPKWALPLKVTETGAQGGARVTEYEYDAQGKLIRQRITDASVTPSTTTERRWAYNSQGLLASETDEAGHTTNHQYDAQGRRVQSIDALGRQSQSRYDAAGRLIQHTSFEGITTRYTWDARGRLLTQSVQTPDGPLSSSYQWRPDGQISQITQPDGLATTYQYDPAGRLTGWQNNRGQKGSYALDAAGRITNEEVTDAQGTAFKRSWQYGANARLQSQSLGTDPRSLITHRYGHNANGDLISQANGLGQRWQLTRDGLRRVSAEQNPRGHSARIGFNSLNAITQAKDFKGVATQYSRNAQGQATQETSADIGHQHTQYDPRGLPIRHQDAEGRVQSRQYDALGRISQIQWQDTSGGNTQTAQFSYSPSGQISRIQEQGPHSHHTSWQHDAAGRITGKYQAIEAGGGNNNTVPSTYSLGLAYAPPAQGGAGRVARVTYPSGKVLQYRYDASGQLTGLDWQGQPLITNLQWTALGQPAQWQWAFNGQSASRQYSSAGQLIQTEAAQYQYDSAGRLKQIQWQLMAPAANGQSQSIPVQTQITHDANGRLTGVQHTPGAATLPAPWRVQDILGPLQSTYAWDANGNRQSARYQNFGGAGNLQSLQRQFTLNPAHNKVLAVQDTEQRTGGSQTRKTQALQWDASGKLQSDGHLQFQRNAAGKVSQTQNQNKDTTTYITNALGQRIRKQTGSGANRHITDTVYGEEAIAPGLQSFALGHYEHRQTAQGTVPTLTSEYIYIPTPMGPMPIAAEINGRLYAVHTDQLNTPRQLTDANGNKVWQWAISGFGEVEATTAQTGWIRERNGSAGARDGTLPISFNLRFPGQQFDEESGLHYNHHRYYDPYLTVGYTEADPIGLNGGWNRFAYAEGDPLRYWDAEGLVAPAIQLVGTVVIRVCASAVPNISAALTGLVAGAAIVETIDCENNQCKKDNDDICEKKYSEDLKLCSSRAGIQYGSRGVAICESSAMQRYAECLRFGLKGVRTPLHGVETPL